MRNTLIHPSAIVEPGAQIADNVSIGPFSYIGSEVSLHSGVQIKSHVVVTGKTNIGEKTIIYPFAVIGEIPQDLKFAGEKTFLNIGERNIKRACLNRTKSLWCVTIYDRISYGNNIINRDNATSTYTALVVYDGTVFYGRR